MDHQGVVIWMTGLSGSGKTTLAECLATQSVPNRRFFHIDADIVRTGLCAGLGFSDKARRENIRRLAHLAAIVSKTGVIPIVAAITPTDELRTLARSVLENENVKYVEAFIDCPLEVCEERDPKGLYKRARAGEIRDFTGISAPYTAPDHPNIWLNTAYSSPDHCVRQIISYLKYWSLP